MLKKQSIPYLRNIAAFCDATGSCRIVAGYHYKEIYLTTVCDFLLMVIHNHNHNLWLNCNAVALYHTYIFLFNTQGLVPQFRSLVHFHLRHQGHKIKILNSVLCSANTDSNTAFYVKNFDDQKFKNPHSWKKLQFIYPSASVKDVQATGEDVSP